MPEYHFDLQDGTAVSIDWPANAPAIDRLMLTFKPQTDAEFALAVETLGIEDLDEQSDSQYRFRIPVRVNGDTLAEAGICVMVPDGQSRPRPGFPSVQRVIEQRDALKLAESLNG